MTDTPAAKAVAPVVKSLVVGLPVEAAFRLFTVDANRWWPLATHSVFGEAAAECHLQGWLDGRFYEVHRDGAQQAEWGRVLAWEPPRRLLFSFYPGHEPDPAQQVEVVFEPEADGTRVTLTHRGWERLGGQQAMLHARYDEGWAFLLNQYSLSALTPASPATAPPRR
jgi:uncharacterized protein YndB with AHSA1/START domain